MKVLQCRTTSQGTCAEDALGGMRHGRSTSSLVQLVSAFLTFCPSHQNGEADGIAKIFTTPRPDGSSLAPGVTTRFSLKLSWGTVTLTASHKISQCS